MNKTIETAQVPTDAVVAARRHKHQRFWPDYAEGSSRIPEILANEPEFGPLQAERRATFAAMAREGELRDAVSRRNAAAKVKHDEGLRWALETGNPIPPPFVPEEDPISGFTKAWWDDKLASINAAEVGLMHEISAKLTARLERRAAKTEARLQRAEKELAEAEAAHRPYGIALGELALTRESDEQRMDRERREALEEIPWSGPTMTSTYEDPDGDTVIESTQKVSTRTKLPGRR